MERKLGILGLMAILAFIAFSMMLDFETIEAFNATLIGKCIISFMIFSALVPWFYLLTKYRDKVTQKEYLIIFLGCWLLAPFFLLMLASNKDHE